MSKSKGNVVNPDEYVANLGTDTVRAYVMFIAPWEMGGNWDDSGIAGISRWLNRVWNLVEEVYSSQSSDGDNDLIRMTHQTIKKATEDFDKIRLNTMISALMELTNYLYKVKEIGNVSNKTWKESTSTLLLLLAPTAPHITEELWSRLGNKYSIHNQTWPKWDAQLAQEEEILLVIQVNGKVRDKITAAANITENEAIEKARNSEKAAVFVAGKTIVKEIYVPGKLVNLVVK